MRHYIALSVAISLFLVPWLAVNYPDKADLIVAEIRSIGSQLAAVVLHNPRTVAQLQEKYNSQNKSSQQNKIKVVIVPGHEPNFGGTEYGDIKERDLVVGIADNLARFLQESGKYEVVVTRSQAAWNPVFDAYFKNSEKAIVEWQKDYKAESVQQISMGLPLPPPKVYHNNAPPGVANRLYGITKWSNENAVDVAIHIHLNDYPGHGQRVAGKYSGFSIYTPEEQYFNSKSTRAVSESIFKRLQRYNPVSDLPGESDGIVPERELIAIGANNTADAASLLIEYGYIYEPQFVNPDARDLALKDLAYQTYLGLEDFFNPNGLKNLAITYDTLMLPYTWKETLSPNSKNIADIYALQTALSFERVYPPANRSKNDCPRTGRIGPCTEQAIKDFQKKNGLEITGIVGPQTLEVLNRIYSGRVM
ncbi:MAG: putative peptidoglycan binding domain [Candidatus Parcubacteria bacterium]|jgi:N-acetylmuramoyl-L-alanine amidase